MADSAIAGPESGPKVPVKEENVFTIVPIHGPNYTTALVAANAGTPPQTRTVHAIIGGTGKYSGARGKMILRPLSDTTYRVAFFFVY